VAGHTGEGTVNNLRVVGKPVVRIDATDKVSGRLRYATDAMVPGMLWSATLRSPYPHARLLKLDIGPALELEGIKAVVTASDIQGSNRHGIERQDQPILVGVGEKVHMVGDPIAAVAAISEHIAESALKLIHVEYEVLPDVSSPQEALSSDAPRLHDETEGNLISEYTYQRGDINRGFSQADVIVEGEIILPRQEQAYLEVEGGLATVDAQGIITIWAASQRQVYTRKSIGKALGIPENKLRILSPTTGGGFGGKADLTLHALMALLVQRTQRPIKMVWKREESIQMHPKRHPFRIWGKLGAKRDGTITALQMDILSDAGAYASHSAIVLFAACSYLPGPYDIPNLDIRGRTAYTNNPISGAFRGYGQPQGATALEILMDWLAHDLSMDPTELRLQNALELGDEPGCPRIAFETPSSLPLTISAAMKAAGDPSSTASPGKLVGRGISCAMPIFDISNLNAADMKGVGADVEMLLDGTAVVHSGVCEIGSGITTVLAQIAAEELGLEVEQVSVINGDTESTPDAGPIVSSRQAYCSGNAVRLATKQVRERLLGIASEIIDTEIDEMVMADGMIKSRTNDREISLQELLDICHRTGVNLVGNGWFTGAGKGDGYTFMTTVADVEVDSETGMVEVLKLVIAHDCGKVLNPVIVKGQLLGGAMMGLGYALCEEMPTSEGKVLTPTLTEYLTPTSVDIPGSCSILTIEEPFATGPYGAKGVGEHATDCVPAAIINAIFQATGVKIDELPATPERIYWKLRPEGRRS
jgi:CO/xanthine dehydrogenase Mo-binding subunit